MKPTAKKKLPKTGVDLPGMSKRKKRRYARAAWVCVGVDASYYGISVAVVAKTTEGKIRVGTAAKRWTKVDDYFSRLADAAKGHEILLNAFQDAKVMCELHQVFIAQEEPVAIGHLQRIEGRVMKQQCEISGAFLGSLFRWGWHQVWQIQANQWRALVARDLGITIHHTKWNPDKWIGKFRAKQWVKEFHPTWDKDWPDIIKNEKHGMIPRPVNSRAKPVQSNDLYEALAMAQWMREALKTMKSLLKRNGIKL